MRWRPAHAVSIRDTSLRLTSASKSDSEPYLTYATTGMNLSIGRTSSGIHELGWDDMAEFNDRSNDRLLDFIKGEDEAFFTRRYTSPSRLPHHACEHCGSIYRREFAHSTARTGTLIFVGVAINVLAQFSAKMNCTFIKLDIRLVQKKIKRDACWYWISTELFPHPAL